MVNLKEILLKVLLSVALMTISIPGKSINHEETGYRWNGHSLSASIGGSLILSKMYETWSSGNPRCGFDWQVEYGWNSKRFFGAGFLYKGYYASGSEVIPIKNGNLVGADFDQSFYINYWAPQFTGQLVFGKGKWCFSFAMGVGFSMVTQSGRTPDVKGHSGGSGLSMRISDYGWGINESLGIEYRCSRRFGLVASLSMLNSYISQDVDDYGISYNDEKDEATGISRLSIDLGVKFHF